MFLMLFLAATAACVLMVTADSDVTIIRIVQALVFASILTLLVTGFAIALAG